MARLLDVSPQVVNNWRAQGKVPARYARAFSTHAQVSIKRLVHNWTDYWPELATQPDAAVEVT